MGNIEAGQRRHHVAWIEGVEQLRMPARRAWFTTAFMSVWLAGWLWAGSKVLQNPFETIVVIWLIPWLLGFCVTVIVLAGLIAGVDEIHVQAGELVITRRVGPIYRRWRYSTNKVRNLRMETTPWPGDGGDGAQYTIFVKQQWGAVRFDYGAETVHVAPGISAPEAREIRDWLLRRLPVSANS